ncbi:phage-related lytic murein transglycosylase [Thioalkalivibrio sulfidiphilus HL-EbGr7]|uniref:Phage-related lytic murein transglycosylase n=1 Tax=Thioalkalivibrio sulfidiphilus (strain HL-EbGR7) TaxID=396588 RepID=B8GS27_THISH|nr:transglycosylase SLT domain-containing protein [Thioalkalivibrio sulfidiphilus]ACL72731.1 phage-related lytic murein transglycosylase [Thioalkalivibrio sulfidiphilus HL-EbGr7]
MARTSRLSPYWTDRFRAERQASGLLRLLIGLWLLAWLFSEAAHAQALPAAAQQHQRELTRVVQQEWGMGGRVAVHAAQIHQESGWRAHVDSPVGAQGLAQFMPGTSAWIVEIYPDLGRAAPYSPAWAMRAMVRYNRWHWRRIQNAADVCERWAFTLSAYNGGLGWVNRDRRLATAAGDDPAVWFGSVERYTARAGWAERENRHYVRRILLELAPRYDRAGWHGGLPC